MAFANGYAAALTIGGQAIQKITSCSHNLSKNLIDATTMDSNEWKENAYGQSQVTMDVSGFYEEATGIEDILQEAYSNETLGGVAIIFTPAASDTFTFNAAVSNLSIEASSDGLVEFSCTLESTGTVVYASP